MPIHPKLLLIKKPEEIVAELKKLGKDVADAYDKLRLEKPVFVRELARQFGIPYVHASFALKMLREKDQAAMKIIELHADKGVGLSISSDLGTYIKHSEYLGSLGWDEYKLHWRPETQHLVEQKQDLIRTLSILGRRYSAEPMERALAIAVSRAFPYLRRVITPFSSPYPDVVVIPERLGVEISARWDNPLDHSYCERKLELLHETYPEFDLLVIGPKFTSKLWEEHAGKIRERDAPPDFYIEKLPIEGFPLFMPPHIFRAAEPLFTEVGRKVVRVTRAMVVDMLVPIMTKYRIYTRT